jgi:hypothetical protein
MKKLTNNKTAELIRLEGEETQERGKGSEVRGEKE